MDRTSEFDEKKTLESGLDYLVSSLDVRYWFFFWGGGVPYYCVLKWNKIPDVEKEQKNLGIIFAILKSFHCWDLLYHHVYTVFKVCGLYCYVYFITHWSCRTSLYCLIFDTGYKDVEIIPLSCFIHSSLKVFRSFTLLFLSMHR